jgi:hypothetical protein
MRHHGAKISADRSRPNHRYLRPITHREDDNRDFSFCSAIAEIEIGSAKSAEDHPLNTPKDAKTRDIRLRFQFNWR